MLSDEERNNCFLSYLFRLPLCKPGKNGEPGPLPPDLKEGGGEGEGGEDRPALKKGGGGRRGKKGKKGGQLRLLQERCAHCQELYTEVGPRIGDYHRVNTVLRIRDVYPGSDFFPSRNPDPNCLHPGSRIRIKEFKYFNPKKQKNGF